MRHSFKKVLSVVLALMMLTALLASCGGGGGKNGDENQTAFTIMGGMSTLSSGYDSNPVLQKLAEDAGVEIEWDLYSDSLSEVVGTRIGGNQLPDAFIAVNFSQGDIAEYGSDETFIDLTPYITPEIMPNLSRILEDYPEVRSAITMADGKIYGLPSAEMMGTAQIGAEENYGIFSIPEFMYINKTWLDELNLPMPTNLTELHDVLKAFKDNDMATRNGNAAGMTIPFSSGYDQWCWGQEMLYAGFGFTNFTNDVCADLMVDENGKVYFASAQDNYRDAVTYIHDWFAEGLMDLEMFSQSQSQFIAKGNAGRIGVLTYWEAPEILGDYADDYVFLPPLKGPEGTEYADTCEVNIRANPAVTSGNLNITSACGNPELLCRYFDQWYDGEIVMQLQYGPIGIYYAEEKDENGVWVPISDEEARERFGKSSGELKGQYEVYGPKLLLPEYYNHIFYNEERATQRLEYLENDWLPYSHNRNYYPLDVTFTEDELDVIDRYKANFVSQVAEYEGRWIKDGGPTDEEWQEYLTVLKDNCGMERLLAVYQDAYDRYTGAQG